MTKTATKEVTIKELAAVFEGKYVSISSTDHYGISIEIHKGTIEYEDDLKPELWFVSRDNENNVTGSVCISEDIIESIEESNGIYTINFNFSMTSVDISRYKTLEELQENTDEKEKNTMSKENKTNGNLKALLERKVKNLLVTHSPSIETDYPLSGEMKKYCFEHPVEVKIVEDMLVVSEYETGEAISLELSKITDCRPISKNDKIAFPQEYTLAMLYDEGQVVTFYFD